MWGPEETSRSEIVAPGPAVRRAEFPLGGGLRDRSEPPVPLTLLGGCLPHHGVRHPLVRTHPETGKKALYFHLTKASGIEGMETEEVRPFLEDLLDKAVKPENTLRHHWKLGDVVICDNRCAMHRADPNYDQAEERLLWRVILKGDRPV